MTILILFICLTLVVAMCAAVFVYGRQIGYTNRNAELIASEKKVLEEQVHQYEAYIQQLEFQIDAESKRKAQDKAKDGWEAFDTRRSS